MSTRMMRWIDVITAYGRWLALVFVPLLALLAPTSELELGFSMILIPTVGMAAINIIPVVMLYFKFFPDVAALVFLILDNVFALGLLLVGPPSMFYYCFFPVVALAIRFDWLAGLTSAAVMTVGYGLIALGETNFHGAGPVLASIAGQLVSLLVVSLLAGVLAEFIKREPPLNAREVQSRQEELQSLRAAADRARAIYQMASTLSATLNYERILDAVLDISAVGFDELDDEGKHFRERPASAVFLFGQDGLYIAAARSISYEEMDQVLPGERGLLHKVLGTGDPALVSSLVDDPELGKFAAFRRCRSAICVPLRAGFESYGAILFASPRADAFGDGHIDLLNAVSNQAAVALTNAQLYQDLVREKEHIIAVEEDARTKLARDLHDGPTQSISAIAMRLNFVRLLLGRDPQKVKDELFKLENLARRTTKEIRTMLFTLRPVVLETQGLKAAVEQLADKFKEMGDLPIRLEISIQAVAWYITQEALNNTKKYASASQVDVKMYIENDYFITEIIDDGQGFDVQKTMSTYDERGSFGLMNFQERAELVNGRTTIESSPGKGTKITLIVPLSRDAV
jgi:signal transduction histidine kinase